jgi:hypothetical protein
VAPAVEHLSSKHGTLSSNPVLQKKRKKKKDNELWISPEKRFKDENFSSLKLLP